MPKVYNKHHGDAPKDAVYVGRPSKWGNPYSHLLNTKALYKVESREEAIEAYRLRILHLHPQIAERARKELKGKDLVCWCAPKPCHADILLEIANG